MEIEKKHNNTSSRLEWQIEKCYKLEQQLIQKDAEIKRLNKTLIIAMDGLGFYESNYTGQLARDYRREIKQLLNKGGE